MSSFFDELESMVQGAVKPEPAKVVTPSPAGMYSAPAPAAPAPVSAPVAEASPAASFAAELDKYITTEPVAKVSNEPTIVAYVPEPAPSAPAGTKAFDAAGKLLGTVMPDGRFVAAPAETEDVLAHLKAEDKRPVDVDEESRTDLAQRTSGRISFLTSTYESEKEDPKYPERRTKRLANDIHRGLAARTPSIFDPEKSANAAEIKRFSTL